jgi:CRISPR-associated protein Csm2
MDEYKNFKNHWVNTNDETEAMVKWAQKFGSELSTQINQKRGTELTTSQLRKFFGEVKRQQAKGFDKSDIILLKPKLAYAVGRNGKGESRIKQFYFVIANAVDQVKDMEDFKRFIKIFEAIVAYHKAAEESNLTDKN